MAKAYTKFEEFVEEYKHRSDNVVQLITGGKQPPSGASDWLTDLMPMTKFTAKALHPRSPEETYITPLFIKVVNSERGVMLYMPTGNQNMYIDPGAFCNHYRLFENMGPADGPDPVVEEITDDGDRV